MNFKEISRRDFLKLTVSAVSVVVVGESFAGCKRPYVRPPGMHDLGEVGELLGSKQLLREKSLLVFRDDHGWSVVSAQCTIEGCDLTFQENTLLCSCCRSEYDHRGHPLRGRAKVALPWYQISYEAGHLYADSGKVVDESTRFTTPDIEKVVGELRGRMPAAQTDQGAPIPNILKGKSDGEKGPMFKEYDPSELLD